VSGPLGSTSALEWAAWHAVSITDILGVHRGATWRDFYSRQTWGGGGGPGVPWCWNRGKTIEVAESPRVPGELVQWSAIEDLIRVGTTIGDLVEASDAMRLHCASLGSYPDGHRRFEAVRSDVITRGLTVLVAPPVGQMSLFDSGAAA